MSPIDQYSIDFTDSIDSEIQFTRVPAVGPPRDGSLPLHGMLTIRRDSTHDSTNDPVTQIPSTNL
jgi:hypothetical protein